MNSKTTTDLGFVADLCPGITALVGAEYDMAAEELRVAYNGEHMCKLGSPWLEDELDEIEQQPLFPELSEAAMVEHLERQERRKEQLRRRRSHIERFGNSVIYRIHPDKRPRGVITYPRDTSKDEIPIFEKDDDFFL